jgi:ribosome-binding factor A
MSRRTERVASTIQHELAQIMMRELTDPRLAEHMISITRVKVSPDISIADVYVTVMGTPGQQTAALNALKHSAGLMRTKLTKQLALRVAPFLKFHIDENLKKELAVLDLIDKAAKETAELDRQRAAEQAPDGSAPPPPPADQTSPHDQNPKAE